MGVSLGLEHVVGDLPDEGGGVGGLHPRGVSLFGVGVGAGAGWFVGGQQSEASIVDVGCGGGGRTARG